jgi:hypothetical protein
MRKVIREIIQRGVRRVARSPGISILLRAISKARLKRNGGNDKAAVCVIVLDEERYIDEWIQYNLFLGFSHIVIYDNSDRNEMAYLSEKYKPFVTVIHFPGRFKQYDAYNHFTLKYKCIYRWGAFIDSDEFIVLRSHNNIESFLKEYCEEGAVALNWLLFGNNGHLVYENMPVLQRFTRRCRAVDRHVKAIVNLIGVDFINNSHFPLLIHGQIKTTHRKVIEGPYNPGGDFSIAAVHHYFCKSEEEFDAKCRKGRVDIAQERLKSDYEGHGSNDISDSSAWDFYRSRLPFEGWLDQKKRDARKSGA